MTSPAAALPEPRLAPPVRLRYLLGGLAALWLGVAAVPRIRAAFQLPTAATAFANYALCMAGPTAVALLRDNPTEFRRLVRTRLLASPPDEQPFRRCAAAAEELGAPSEAVAAHGARAGAFAEYGLLPAAGPAPRLDALGVSTERLASLSEQAWPLLRGGYTSLVVPSPHAREAPHPLAPPVPALSREVLPARPFQGGAACAVPGASAAFSLGTSGDGARRVLRTAARGGVTTEAVLGASSVRVIAGACDERAAVVVLAAGPAVPLRLAICAPLGECTQANLPGLGAAVPPGDLSVDVARVHGTTVVALGRAGVVRVASSRDDARSWTPLVVAQDAATDPRAAAHGLADRLATSGRRLVLHGTPRRSGMPYPVLVSDDAGASFRAP